MIIHSLRRSDKGMKLQSCTILANKLKCKLKFIWDENNLLEKLKEWETSFTFNFLFPVL